MNKFLDGNGLRYLWGKLRAAVELKQDKLTGTQGQIVGFDASGSAVAQDAPVTGVASFNGRSGAVTPQSGDYTAAQVGARPSTWTPTASDVGAVPTSRKVNGKALSADVTLTASDVGALPDNLSELKIAADEDNYSSLHAGGLEISALDYNVKKSLILRPTGVYIPTGMPEDTPLITGAYDTWEYLCGLSVNGNRLMFVGDPESNTDAANKQYVDTAIRTAIAGAMNASY